MSSSVCWPPDLFFGRDATNEMDASGVEAAGVSWGGCGKHYLNLLRERSGFAKMKREEEETRRREREECQKVYTLSMQVCSSLSSILVLTCVLSCPYNVSCPQILLGTPTKSERYTHTSKP
jgi:hypothetical protein